MGGMSKSILVLVTLILALCAGGGFALGLMSTASRRVAGATEDAAPVAGTIAVSGAIPDAQPLAAPPPPPPPKPKVAAIEPAASDLPPAAAAPPTESPPAAPPPPAPPKTPAPLPADLPPT
jgi:hypothetical protein